MLFSRSGGRDVRMLKNWEGWWALTGFGFFLNFLNIFFIHGLQSLNQFMKSFLLSLRVIFELKILSDKIESSSGPASRDATALLDSLNVSIFAEL